MQKANTVLNAIVPVVYISTLRGPVVSTCSCGDAGLLHRDDVNPYGEE